MFNHFLGVLKLDVVCLGTCKIEIKQEVEEYRGIVYHLTGCIKEAQSDPLLLSRHCRVTRWF